MTCTLLNTEYRCHFGQERLSYHIGNFSLLWGKMYTWKFSRKRGGMAQEKKQEGTEEWKAQLQSANASFRLHQNSCQEVSVQHGEESSHPVSIYAPSSQSPPSKIRLISLNPSADFHHCLSCEHALIKTPPKPNECPPGQKKINLCFSITRPKIGWQTVRGSNTFLL